jgi:hypothetical protein
MHDSEKKTNRLISNQNQPPVSSSFLSERTSHLQPTKSTFLSEQINISYQSPAKRTGCNYASGCTGALFGTNSDVLSEKTQQTHTCIRRQWERSREICRACDPDSDKAKAAWLAGWLQTLLQLLSSYLNPFFCNKPLFPYNYINRWIEWIGWKCSSSSHLTFSSAGRALVRRGFIPLLAGKGTRIWTEPGSNKRKRSNLKHSQNFPPVLSPQVHLIH